MRKPKLTIVGNQPVPRTPEHSFPLGLEQVHILEEAKEQIEHQPTPEKVAPRARASLWSFVALAVVGGLLLGFLRKVRR
jgi:hypothetical protein